MADAEKARALVVNRLCEFLIVVTHAILYIHDVYPQRMFEMREKYGVGTFYSRHAAVNEYISTTVGSLREWLMKDLIEWITIVVYESETQSTIARYTFESNVVASSEQDVSAASLSSLENALRAHLCRVLSTAVARPAARGEAHSRGESSFDYIIGTKGVRTDAQWMPADLTEQRTLPRAQTTPLKDAHAASTTARVRSYAQLQR